MIVDEWVHSGQCKVSIDMWSVEPVKALRTLQSYTLPKFSVHFDAIFWKSFTAYGTQEGHCGEIENNIIVVSYNYAAVEWHCWWWNTEMHVLDLLAGHQQALLALKRPTIQHE